MHLKSSSNCVGSCESLLDTSGHLYPFTDLQSLPHKYSNWNWLICMEMEVSDEVQFYCKVLQVPSMSCIHTSKHYKVRLHSCIWVQNHIKQKNYCTNLQVFCSDLQLLSQFLLQFCEGTTYEKACTAFRGSDKEA